MLDWYSEAPQGNTNIPFPAHLAACASSTQRSNPADERCGLLSHTTPTYPTHLHCHSLSSLPSHPPTRQAFLYVTNACVSIFGFAICVASGTALAVPNVLTSDELDLTSALRYTVVVGVFLLLMGLWGTCGRQFRSRARHTRIDSNPPRPVPHYSPSTASALSLSRLFRGCPAAVPHRLARLPHLPRLRTNHLNTTPQASAAPAATPASSSPSTSSC